MCENFPEKLAFAFLTDVQKSFIEKYDYDKIASFFSYQLTEFDQNLSKLIKEVPKYATKLLSAMCERCVVARSK